MTDAESLACALDELADAIGSFLGVPSTFDRSLELADVLEGWLDRTEIDHIGALIVHDACGYAASRVRSAANETAGLLALDCA